jgi:hypothetical protein
MHDAETFYVVVDGKAVINAVKIIEALFLTCSHFYIFNIEYYQDNIASWQFIQHVIAEKKDGKFAEKSYHSYSKTLGKIIFLYLH